MTHSELTYFEGFHFAHIAAYEETRRLRRIGKEWNRFFKR
jgi:hypothetical protein